MADTASPFVGDHARPPQTIAIALARTQLLTPCLLASLSGEGMAP